MAKKKTKEAAFTDDDDALLAELGVETEIKQDQTYTAKQERIIAGFEDIQRFYREHERLPQHGEGRDIFERLYAVRLDRIRGNAECLELLRPMDADGVLTDRVSEPSEEYELDSDDELLEALGVSPEDNDITTMKHVRSAAERNAERNVPEEVAQRKPCEDFDAFRLDFEAVQADLETGRQSTELFKTSSRSQIRRVTGLSSTARRRWLQKQVSGLLLNMANVIDAYESSSTMVPSQTYYFVHCAGH